MNVLVSLKNMKNIANDGLNSRIGSDGNVCKKDQDRIALKDDATPQKIDYLSSLASVFPIQAQR